MRPVSAARAPDPPASETPAPERAVMPTGQSAFRKVNAAEGEGKECPAGIAAEKGPGKLMEC